MATLIPKATTCHPLHLPTTEKDDRLNLNVRTGSASTLYNSLVFAFGGLTIGLEVYEQSITELYETFHLKILNSNSKHKTLSKFLSGEFFYLNLLERNWSRVILDRNAARPSPRLFHELCALNNCVYLFGGLVIPDIDEPTSAKNFLIPCNDLWEFNLELSTWKLLHDGSNYDSDSSIPIPRFNHKMTSIKSLTFVNKKDHFGIFIAGGKDGNSRSIYDNVVFDLVEKRYVGQESFELKLKNDKALSVDASNSIIITFQEEVDHLHHHKPKSITEPPKGLTNQNLNLQNLSPQQFLPSRGGRSSSDTAIKQEELIIVYASSKTNNSEKVENPLTSFKLGKNVRVGKHMPIHKKKESPWSKNEKLVPKKDSKVILHTMPFNLRYPTGGIFGQNVVITGFLPDEYEISIFIYNKPTGKWSRLNIFCNHDYGLHRFWGGYVWQSHHKVVLIGNFITSRTTSSIRFFTSMLTVSLPVTNILASSEISGTQRASIAKNNDLALKIDSNTSSGVTEESVTDESSSSNHRSTSDDEMEIEGDILKQPRKFSVQSMGSKTSPTTTSFSDYVHYAAPKTNFTKIRSVFPPAAITLGRNAFDRYGDLISDFEIVSSSGDRIPVSMVVLMERWGRYFIELLARAYVHAVDKFETDQLKPGESAKGLRSSRLATNSIGINDPIPDEVTQKKFRSSASSPTTPEDKSSNRNSFYISLPIPASKAAPKEAPHFRLPFQESLEEAKKRLDAGDASPSSKDLTFKISLASTPSDSSLETTPSDEPAQTPIAVIEPSKSRKDSVSSFTSNNSLLTSHLQDIPPQLPLPNEQIPAVPATPTSFRNSSRKNSSDLSSPRASLIQTLSQLRNINIKSPMGSPFASPRASFSGQGSGSGPLGGADSLTIKRRGSANDAIPERKAGLSKLSSFTSVEGSSRKPSRDSDDEDDSFTVESGPAVGIFENSLLDFDNLKSGKFRMEPSLIPRKLYIPFSSVTLRAFCEYLYTGQVGNKWLLVPTALDNLGIAKSFKVPLLYDLISEVLFGIIGRKEAHIIKEGSKLKKKYIQVLDASNSSLDSEIIFPLDEYEGFMETVDDGFLDVALLQKSSNVHKNSSVFSSRRRSSRRTSANTEHANSKNEEEANESEMTGDGEEKQSDKPNESTSDSDKKGTSEEDFDFQLAFLELYNQSPLNTDFKSRSVFDKPKVTSEVFVNAMQDPEDSEQEGTQQICSLTLEELVSPDSKAPSDGVIDHIYEMAAIVVDMKLMLRALNVRLMNRILAQTRVDVERSIAVLQKKQQEKQEEMDAEALTILSLHKSESDLQTTNLYTSATDSAPLSPRTGEHFDKTEPAKLKTSHSSASISTSTYNKTPTPMDKSRSNTAFRSISGFTPFKQKPDPKNSNKELDKRITKMIKQDEKLKLKSEKERVHLERLEKLVNEKAAKKDKKRHSTASTASAGSAGNSTGGLPPTILRASSQSTLLGMSSGNGSATSVIPPIKKHHSFFHLGYKKAPAVTPSLTSLTGDSATELPERLDRTHSSSGSLHSSASKQLEKKKGLFGLHRS